MLRKKLKLEVQTSPPSMVDESTSEFTLTQYAYKPKAKVNNQTDAPVKPAVSPEADPGIMPYWQKVYQIELELSAALRNVKLPSEVAACYDPINYAANIHRAYLERFLDGPKAVLFIGMNPGPWGMCQTGVITEPLYVDRSIGVQVPFGFVPAVREWMGLRGVVSKPDPELPARPVEGLACGREEQSGKRWWGLYQELCGSSENFFRSCFVYNLCPLAFFHASGRNITPSELKGKAKGEIQAIAEEYLAIALEVLKPQVIVSVGRYTEDRIKSLIKQKKLDPAIITHCMPHPSPRSLNNTNWKEKAKDWLVEHKIMPYLTA